jgi:hypothetical protein
VGTIPASENVFPLVELAEGAAPATPATGQVRLYVKSDGLLYWKDDAGTEYAVGQAAPDAVDVVFDPTGLSVIAATEVQTALEEVDAAIGAGGIPVTIIDAAGDLIVGSAADTAARLALGTTGQALVSNGTTAVWGAAVTGGEVFITSDVTMTTLNTFYDGPSQSLAAGTYLIWGVICVENSNAATFVTAKLWDGTNVFHAPDSYADTAGAPVSIAVCAYVVLGSTQTVKISAACNKNSGVINDVAQTNGTADKATKMAWIKIA